MGSEENFEEAKCQIRQNIRQEREEEIDGHLIWQKKFGACGEFWGCYGSKNS